eukprot:CAMPEP_0170847328 /NCGR_PEP_ID=MMETSP0734-20130129/8720_1 /TAXON_ID=186038 /ORGANISM="Fragilariopsis kerguelensis, Strain L26-C5" /LENGTH=71 /DNA_ID=CAMNT_0011216531 /DNA_START=288 /DNA_END=504 /DNA_ORIENTATION=+
MSHTNTNTNTNTNSSELKPSAESVPALSIKQAYRRRKKKKKKKKKEKKKEEQAAGFVRQDHILTRRAPQAV